MVRALPLLLAAATLLHGASATWLQRVGPIITPAEKKAYLALPPAARAGFEENFWATRSIDAEEYFRRLNYTDGMWGSDKPGSGANTDPGRVYLAIGAPTRLTKLPSSRTFVPLEIWYYDSVPGVLSTELRLLFFRPNSMGLPKLYSPLTDTVRALLVPQAGTTKAFGPNQTLGESDLRGVLKTSPGEDEVITAATGIASGIKGSGAQEILALVTSPETMLSRAPKAKVTARLVTAATQFETFMVPSAIGGTQVDLRIRAAAARQISLEIFGPEGSLVVNRVQLSLPSSRAIVYTHRVDLLPGAYRAVFAADEATSALSFEIPQRGGIVRANRLTSTALSHTPFEFGGVPYVLDPQGTFALVAAPGNESVTWLARKGSQVVWRTTTPSNGMALVELPKDVPPGDYRLEAITKSDSASTDLNLRPADPAPEATAISYNANLSPALRYAFVGRQWLLRGKTTEAKAALAASLREGKSTEAQLLTARLEALDGNLDSARDQVKAVLAGNPNHFEALTIYAYIETQLQDFPVAAQLYKRALAIQDSAPLRAALAALPKQ